MKSVRVEVDYTYSDGMMLGKTTLPVKILDAEGAVLFDGAACRGEAATFEIRDDVSPIFARLTWPSGQTETQRVRFDGASATVEFTDAQISPNEWAAWAVPRLASESQRDPRDVMGSGISRFDNVWIRLWQFDATWKVFRPQLSARDRSDSARQIDLTLESRPYLLQIGGPNVPWKFISVPGAGRARILITTNRSTDPRADPLKTAVTGFRIEAETLLEFLSRDAMRSAKALAQYGPGATRLMSEKTQDPVAALAGAYFLLRTGGWQGREFWFENLFNIAGWTSDSAILKCALQLRKGTSNLEEPFSSLMVAVNRGSVPIFAEGIGLLQECVSLLRSQVISKRAEPGSWQATMDEINSLADLVAAQAWAGSMASFYGQAPQAPNPGKYVGSLDHPRLQSSARSFINDLRVPSTPLPPGETSDIERLFGGTLTLGSPIKDAMTPQEHGAQQASSQMGLPEADHLMLGDL